MLPSVNEDACRYIHSAICCVDHGLSVDSRPCLIFQGKKNLLMGLSKSDSPIQRGDGVYYYSITLQQMLLFCSVVVLLCFKILRLKIVAIYTKRTTGLS